uniref:DOT1 domain-containing protein n=1 Tax=Odontella aurita TaxID=265563 RepID=A0A7S4MCR6_9STRA|mmetsp:Transcript_18393/g.53049  ORF Transcript_18393/g.53049 Transcript_18393/m.53049 type:complete len:332 (+) Transcript_18393:115-1110(+)|eukprot:CAMPEP_0113560964 /NCGR_PEP_ID=MMETSP0015_2-20120614/19724_1 /TAXON_ID=2838 /ORGANISM="Odontella" /LENGTH=331 /DNA_ID=CAMNT_0000462729 /DNA_START=55 /DNA_END=1050 /DNA_ORIENTATION=+ /assembly_acc=CAM_ASM_000160
MAMNFCFEMIVGLNLLFLPLTFGLPCARISFRSTVNSLRQPNSLFGGRANSCTSRHGHGEDGSSAPENEAFALSSNSAIAFVKERPISRADAESIVDDLLFPAREHARRLGLGRDAQNLDPGTMVGANDPRMAFTYGEFPLQSCDSLLDIAIRMQKEPSKGRKKLVDLGSGAGRLVLYLALTRGEYDVHGIEISDILHDAAIEFLERGKDAGIFSTEPDTVSTPRKVQFHCGPANSMQDVLANADVIFAYSTVWPTSKSEDSVDGFSVELGALILGEEWSKMLAEYCRSGCAVVTTDRALDPSYGWELVDRQDVENPEVFGSTGYIHILRK